MNMPNSQSHEQEPSSERRGPFGYPRNNPGDYGQYFELPVDASRRRVKESIERARGYLAANGAMGMTDIRVVGGRVVPINPANAAETASVPGVMVAGIPDTVEQQSLFDQ